MICLPSPLTWDSTVQLIDASSVIDWQFTMYIYQLSESSLTRACRNDRTSYIFVNVSHALHIYNEYL